MTSRREMPPTGIGLTVLAIVAVIGMGWPKVDAMPLPPPGPGFIGFRGSLHNFTATTIMGGVSTIAIGTVAVSVDEVNMFSCVAQCDSSINCVAAFFERENETESVWSDEGSCVHHMCETGQCTIAFFPEPDAQRGETTVFVKHIDGGNDLDSTTTITTKGPLDDWVIEVFPGPDLGKVVEVDLDGLL